MACENIMNLEPTQHLKMDRRLIIAVCLTLVLLSTIGCGRSLRTRFDIIRYADDVQDTTTHDEGFTVIEWKNDQLRLAGFTEVETK